MTVLMILKRVVCTWEDLNLLRRCHPCGPKVSAVSEVGGELRSCIVEVRVEIGAARWRQHHVGVAGELRHLTASTLGLPTVKRDWRVSY